MHVLGTVLEEIWKLCPLRHNVSVNMIIRLNKQHWEHTARMRNSCCLPTSRDFFVREKKLSFGFVGHAKTGVFFSKSKNIRCIIQHSCVAIRGSSHGELQKNLSCRFIDSCQESKGSSSQGCVFVSLISTHVILGWYQSCDETPQVNTSEKWHNSCEHIRVCYWLLFSLSCETKNQKPLHGVQRGFLEGTSNGQWPHCENQAQQKCFLCAIFPPFTPTVCVAVFSIMRDIPSWMLYTKEVYARNHKSTLPPMCEREHVSSFSGGSDIEFFTDLQCWGECVPHCMGCVIPFSITSTRFSSTVLVWFARTKRLLWCEKGCYLHVQMILASRNERLSKKNNPTCSINLSCSEKKKQPRETQCQRNGVFVVRIMKLISVRRATQKNVFKGHNISNW